MRKNTTSRRELFLSSSPLFKRVLSWQVRRESNPDLWYRKPLFYPLNYGPSEKVPEARRAAGDVKEQNHPAISLAKTKLWTKLSPMKKIGPQSERLKSAIRDAVRADLTSIFRLAYVSRVSDMFQPDDLKKIGEVSARRNSEADITGILVMNDGNILQILEGEKNAVVDLFEKISRDPRHEEVRQVAGGEDSTRLLSCWSLVGGAVASVPESLMNEFQNLHSKLCAREQIEDITAEEVELLKVIALFKSVPL